MNWNEFLEFHEFNYPSCRMARALVSCAFEH